MRTFLLLLALAGVAWAAPPAKSVPLEVTGDTVRVVRSFPIKIAAPAGGRDYTWLYPSSFEADEADNFLVIKSAPKGTHKIRVKVLWVDLKKPAPDDVAFDRGDTVIVVGDVPGPVPPAPPPGPTPDPTPPKVGKVYAVALMDDVRTPAQARAVGDSAMWARVEATGSRYRVWDKTKDAGLIAEKKLAKYATLAGYPCLVLMDSAGGVLKYQALPATAEELENSVRALLK